MFESRRQQALLIGVPVVVEAQTVAVIEVMQRLESSEPARRGYVSFVMRLAHIATTSEAFAR